MGLPRLDVAAPPPVPDAPRSPSRTGTDRRSRSSTSSRWAVFGPIPGKRLKASISLATGSISGLATDRGLEARQPETAALFRAMKDAERLRGGTEAGYAPAVARLEQALDDAERAAGVGREAPARPAGFTSTDPALG